jgi:hypothetical protein
MRVVTAASLALVLSACAMEMGSKDSPTYQAGYADGCATGMAEGSSVPMSAKRNNALFSSDKDYRSGWAAGHADCRPLSGPPRL